MAYTVAKPDWASYLADCWAKDFDYEDYLYYLPTYHSVITPVQYSDSMEEFTAEYERSEQATQQ